MFTCSICDETFVGVHQDSTYTTRCGHVFHHHCLMKWLERSHTCPHCRSTVLENHPIKLFLQIDPNARAVWDREVDEELRSLRKEVEKYRERDESNVSKILSLETRINKLLRDIEESAKSHQAERVEYENWRSQVNQLQSQLKALILNNSLLTESKNELNEQLLLEKSKCKLLDKSIYELQGVNAVIIEKLKFEIADLKAEKAYFQNICHSLEKKNSGLPGSSKTSIENTNVISNAIQPKYEYYGHGPHLKLSSKKFLVGCVFLIAENRNKFEDICSDASMTMLNILQYGGIIEYVYSPRITHIICVTQKHFLVEQGLRDGKRCVTDYWLSDVIAKKNMLPPWLAHHFPTPYSKENGMPCLQFQIAIANFDVNEYHIVKTMVEFTGAQVVNEVSSSTDVVVSLNLEGEMVEKAQAIGRPVVNVQWLNDIIFGATFSIKNPTNDKYQQFNLTDPFYVNYDMVLNLMEAWKMPVVFLKNQEVYDLTDSPSKNLKRKRQMSVNQDAELIDLTENDDVNTDDVIITYVGRTSKPCVMFCGFSTTEREDLILKILFLGGTIATQYVEATHLVMKKNIKTIKFLCCLSTVNHVLNESWIIDSHSRSKFQDEKVYHINEIYEECNMVCDVPVVLANSGRNQLFKNLKFFVTPGVNCPSSSHVEEMILSAGGTIEKERKSIYSIRDLEPFTYFIISCLEDFHLVDDLVIIYFAIYSPNFVINSILKQCVEVKHHIISYDHILNSR